MPFARLGKLLWPTKAVHTGRSLADDPDARAAAAVIKDRNPKADPLGRIPDVHPRALPRHIAIIMDGNGRWATRRGLPRALGHRAGAKAVRVIIEEIGKLGIEFVTLYSFSMENWKRPADEVQALMKLYNEQVDLQRDEFMTNNIRFLQIGRREGLPEECLRRRDDLVALTKNNTAGTLVLAVNYGSRAEITDAVRRIATGVQAGQITPEQIDEAMVAENLDTAGIPDPDLLIRTAGEMRLSNYLLWQLSYAELYVTGTLWPDFGPDDLHQAVRQYAQRDRRFGGIKEGR